MLDYQGESLDSVMYTTQTSSITWISAHRVIHACFIIQVFCEEELVEAIATATGPEKDSLCFIEVIVHKDDTSKELLEWGSRVSAANSRPPNPQ